MRNRINSFAKAFLRKESGFAAVEFALIFPTLVLMYFGMMDLTYFITNNRRVMAAASVMADLVTANASFVLGTQLTDYYNAPDIVLAPVPAAKIKVELFNFTSAGAIRWQKNNGRGTCGAAPTSASAAGMLGAGNDVLVARVCTTYTPFFGTFLGTTLLGNTDITLTKTMFQRPRLSTDLKCFATVKDGAAC
jgi:Flp pilus assembly protein TadG